MYGIKASKRVSSYQFVNDFMQTFVDIHANKAFPVFLK